MKYTLQQMMIFEGIEAFDDVDLRNKLKDRNAVELLIKNIEPKYVTKVINIESGRSFRIFEDGKVEHVPPCTFPKIS